MPKRKFTGKYAKHYEVRRKFDSQPFALVRGEKAAKEIMRFYKSFYQLDFEICNQYQQAKQILLSQNTKTE